MESIRPKTPVKRASTLPTKFMETQAVNLHEAYGNQNSHYDAEKKEYALSNKLINVVE